MVYLNCNSYNSTKETPNHKLNANGKVSMVTDRDSDITITQAPTADRESDNRMNNVTPSKMSKSAPATDMPSINNSITTSPSNTPPMIPKPVKSQPVNAISTPSPAPSHLYNQQSHLNTNHQGGPPPSLPHPQKWNPSQTASWLQSQNASDNIIQVVLKEGITGLSLLHLTTEDMAAIGIQLYGERMHLSILIRDLKTEWRIFNSSSPNGVGVGPTTFGEKGGVRNIVVPAGSVAVRMESGKGAPETDAPPSYSQVT
jgi:hypothetical protein